MLRSELPGDEFVRVAVVRSSLQIGRFIRVRIRVGYFRFGNVNDAGTKRCQSVPYRRAKLSIRGACQNHLRKRVALYRQVESRTRPLMQAVLTGPWAGV